MGESFMALRFKDRTTGPRLKKVLVYGMDGSGKSTFAEHYCLEHGLNPVCIDIDDTNYTNVPIVEVNLTTDLTTYNTVKGVIQEISKSKEFDTIILDGVTSLLELLTSKAKGMAAYSDRSKRWNDILRALLVSGKNIIFVGQIDMELIYTPDAQSSKAVIKVNSMVNEKYYTYIDDKGQYCHEVKKFRTLEEIEATAKPEPKPKKAPKAPKVPKPEPIEEPIEEPPIKDVTPRLDNAEEIAGSIIAELPEKTWGEAMKELIRLNRLGVLTDDECPAIKTEIERLLQ